MAKKKLYECTNPACSLGTVGNPGRFTGGITKEQATLSDRQPRPRARARRLPELRQGRKEAN